MKKAEVLKSYEKFFKSLSVQGQAFPDRLKQAGLVNIKIREGKITCLSRSGRIKFESPKNSNRVKASFVR